MSLGTIQALSDRAARKAAQEKKTPYVFWDASEVERDGGESLPFLGTYVPHGWRLVEELFVDSSGMGAEDEPAMTIRAFKDHVKADIEAELGYGYGITEAGQFQVYVGVFERTE